MVAHAGADEIICVITNWTVQVLALTYLAGAAVIVNCVPSRTILVVATSCWSCRTSAVVLVKGISRRTLVTCVALRNCDW